MRLELPDLKYEFIQEINEEKKDGRVGFLFYPCTGYRKNMGGIRHGTYFGKELIAYVDAHYEKLRSCHSRTLRDSFHISRPMVSKILKETAKMNFIDYLHKNGWSMQNTVLNRGRDRCNSGGSKKVGYENEVTFKESFCQEMKV